MSAAASCAPQLVRFLGPDEQQLVLNAEPTMVLPVLIRIPIESRSNAGSIRPKEKGRNYVFRERASVLMGAVLPKKMDGQAVGFRL